MSENLTACRGCRFYSPPYYIDNDQITEHQCVLPVPGMKRHFDPLAGEWGEHRQPNKVTQCCVTNKDGHCKHFKAKEGV